MKSKATNKKIIMSKTEIKKSFLFITISLLPKRKSASTQQLSSQLHYTIRICFEQDIYYNFERLMYHEKTNHK